MTTTLDYQPDFLLARPIFRADELDRLNILAAEYPLHRWVGNSCAFENAALEDAYVSCKIEGNAYTLTEAEVLLKYGLTPGGKHINDALKIKNTHREFEDLCLSRHAKDYLLSKQFLFGVHEAVISNLFGREHTAKIREVPVGVRGSRYVPPMGLRFLETELERLLKTASDIENVFERAVYVHLNLAYLKVFSDGNRRTARLLETAILTDAGCMPLLMKEEDIGEYRRAMLEYYETGSCAPYKKLFLRRYQNGIDELLGRTAQQQAAQKAAGELIRKKQPITSAAPHMELTHSAASAIKR